MKIRKLSGSKLLSPLKFKQYKRLLLSNTLVHIGMWMTTMSVAWHMTELTDSDFLVGLVQTSSTLPVFLLALWAGYIADKMKKSSYLLFSILGAVSTILIYSFLTFYFISVSPLTLLIFVFTLNCFSALIWPAWQAAVSLAVPREEIKNAALLNGLSFNVGRSLGPAIAGFLTSIISIKSIFLFNAILMFPLAIVLYKWRKNEVAPINDNDGLLVTYSKIIKYKPALNLFFITFLSFICANGFWSLLPVLIANTNAGATSFGTIMALTGIGAIGGTLVAPAIREKLSEIWLLRLSMLGFSAICLISPHVSGLLGLYAISIMFGSLTPWHIATINARAQTVTSDNLRSKTLAINLISMYGGMAIGGATWGGVSQAFSPTVSLTACALLLIFTSFIINKRFNDEI
ncbi:MULTISPECIES: MFS transporter [unclassified Halomonas]|uniref:MFS transporter n=1 Tax=unclassified Halomonas TaxID=2609666 RepID=UPI000990822E|nr:MULTISPECIES: MFS transporter [unclassified Halomonas]AQU81286.1 hypothetical protein B2G49_00840 [Halomonas sp. 'Soap Lake \